MLVLKPSKIEGVGVFTTANIRKGEQVFPIGLTPDYKIAPRPLGGEHAKYCVKRSRHPHELGRFKRGWYVPSNPLQMSIGWYLNNSVLPNIDARTGKATEDIFTGDELTITYQLLGE